MISKSEYLGGLGKYHNKIKVSLSGGTTYNLPTASESVKGGVKIGDGLSMTGDTLNVTISSSSYTDFTGAGLSTAGLSGLVPAPSIGDQNKFLCGDGSWANFTLDTISATVDGGFWYELSDDVPVLKLRHGDYEYNFTHDTVTYRGGNSNLVAYLPFNISVTADSCGNSWQTFGSPTISNGALTLPNATSGVTNTTVSDSIGSLPWTIDFWATATGNYSSFFGTFNSLYSGTNGWIAARWNSGKPTLIFHGSDVSSTTSFAENVKYHYAVTYDGETVRLFVDGSLVASRVISVTLSGDFVIGTTPDKQYGATNGSIEKFRIFRGVALWTSDFTVPTAADYV